MINAHFLNEIFEYKNGNLYRKQSAGGQIVGSKVGYLRRDGYFAAKINGVNYLLHRLVFLLHHKYMPIQIDHIDGNPANNTIENLREVTGSQNCMNKSKSTKNKSGYKNVHYVKSSKKWRVQIKTKGVSYCFGCFDDIELADLVAQEVRNKHFGSYAKHQ